MRINKLNPRGFSHHFVMALVVVLVAVGGTAYLVASHASSNPYACAKPYPTLRVDSTNVSCVKHLQWDLVSLWPNNGGQYVKNSGGIDGSFKSGTKQGVQYFQYTKKVSNSGCTTSYTTCDGVVGTYTWNALESTATTTTTAPAWTAIPTSYATSSITPTFSACTVSQTSSAITFKLRGIRPTTSVVSYAMNWSSSSTFATSGGNVFASTWSGNTAIVQVTMPKADYYVISYQTSQAGYGYNSARLPATNWGSCQ